jgi:hypothetical protein
MTNFLLRSTMTNAGLSYWSAYSPCPKKGWYKDAARRAPGAFPIGPPGSFGKPSGTVVGTMFGAYMEAEAYTRLAFFVEVDGQPEPLSGYRQEEDEAWRLAAAYWREYRAEQWTDKQHEVQLVDETGLLGVPRYTGAVDTAARWQGGPMKNAAPGSPFVAAGSLVLRDYKCMEKADATRIEAYRLQQESYLHVWNAKNPTRQAEYAVLDVVMKTKEVKFERLFYTPPTETRLAAIRETFQYFAAQRAAPPLRNTAACKSMYGLCEYFVRCNKDGQLGE